MDELRVAWFDETIVRARVGITMLPGRNDVVPGGQSRDMAQDIDTLWQLGVRRLILLSDNLELDFASAGSLPGMARAKGMAVFRRPTRRDALPSMVVLDEMVDRPDVLGEGDVVYCCLTGLGRSGTVAAARLMRRRGMSMFEALARVRSARGPRAAARPEYEFLLERYAYWLRFHDDPHDGTMPTIPASELTLAMVPETDAPWWPEINEFARTFNGYEYIKGDALNLAGYVELIHSRMGGSGETPPSTGNEFPGGLSLSDFRALLFRLQRNLHDPEVEPGQEWPRPDDLRYARRLLAEIRRLVRETGQ